MGFNNAVGRAGATLPNQPLDEYTRADVDYVGMRVVAEHDISESPVRVAILASGVMPDEDTAWQEPDLESRPTPETADVNLKIGQGTGLGVLDAGVYRMWAKVFDTSTEPAIPSDAEFRVKA